MERRACEGILIRGVVEVESLLANGYLQRCMGYARHRIVMNILVLWKQKIVIWLFPKTQTMSHERRTHWK